MGNRTHRLLLVVALTLVFGLWGSFAQQASSASPLPPPTLELELTCTPGTLPIPGVLQLQVIGHNPMDHPRVYEGSITPEIDGWLVWWGWRNEFNVTIPADGHYYKHFTIQVPGRSILLGNQRFKVRATDVTPPAMDHGIPAGYMAMDYCWVQMVQGK